MARYLTECFRHRDLLFWLAAKEIKVRYKWPLLGVLWALLVPLLLSVILWFVFTCITPISMARYPFFLFLIAGMFPWNFFAQCLSSATMSVLDAGPLIRKTAFPRMLVPLSIVAANLFNFVWALAVVIVLIALIQRSISRWLWLLPAVMSVHVVLTVGMALLVAGLQVRYRDVKYLTEVALMLWFYLTPIFYPLDLVATAPLVVRGLYAANPFVGITELYRLALLGQASGLAPLTMLITCSLSVVLSLGVFLVGGLTFRRYEPNFADWVTG